MHKIVGEYNYYYSYYITLIEHFLRILRIRRYFFVAAYVLVRNNEMFIKYVWKHCVKQLDFKNIKRKIWTELYSPINTSSS